MDKSSRILNLLTLLLNGRIVTQDDIRNFTDVSKKSIQRDINTINTFSMKVLIGIILIRV
ncbi:HTH domain-containing protein [Staphylococcus sp. Marseille-Q1834]|uniref:HTH domain-containing protein n=1 Tax=Staphylococcus sp. Marseille-Q1834 TaxID=2866594 RepID=UPI001CF81041|nr:HTH domain-containing protein [Staphylococcus sp. Marseille-Q1834]